MIKKFGFADRIVKIASNLIVVFLLLVAVSVGRGEGLDSGIGRSELHQGKPVKPIILEGDGWGFVKDGVWEKMDAMGTLTETVLFTEVLAPEVKGFGGHIPLYVYLENGVITRIEIGLNSETPAYLQHIIEQDWMEQFVGSKIDEVQNKSYDVVSGATVSSNAIIRSLKKSLMEYIGSAKNKQLIQRSMLFGVKSIAGVIVIIFALSNFLFFRTNRILRMVQLVLNVFVLGIFCGTVLSMEVLLNYARNGISLSSGILFILILGLTVILLIFRKKNFYCGWLCPFGAAQELLGKIFKINIVLNKKVQQVLTRIRRILLLILLCVAWFINGSYLFSYEPFSIFLLQNVSIAIIIIASSFLLISVFVTKFWCRFVCPTGTILAFFQEDKDNNSL